MSKRSWLLALVAMAVSGTGCGNPPHGQTGAPSETKHAIGDMSTKEYAKDDVFKPRVDAASPHKTPASQGGSMITSEYVAMRFDQIEGWNCAADGPKGAGAFKDRTWTFDFGTGAKAIGLVPADVSLLGEPREIRIRLRGSTQGHPLRVQMVTHFMTFERTLGPLEGEGPHKLIMPAPPAEDWRWFGGENDGKVHGPLRITGLFLDAAGKTGTGRLEMVDIRVTARCPADRTSVLTAELQSAGPAPRFVGVVRSQASQPFDAKFGCVIRDWNGRTVASHSKIVRIASTQPAELAVPVPAGDHVFLEAEFTCEAPGQDIPRAARRRPEPSPGTRLS